MLRSEQDNGGPWSNVQYRKNRKNRGDGVEWTFLVQNLSDRVTRNALWQAFQPYGFISDVYVARKRDARGRCFGFVRYVGVENMKETLSVMNKVKLFDMKVTVALAKYDKDHKRFNYSLENMGRSVWRPKEFKGNDNNNNQQAIKNQASGASGLGPSGPSFVQEGMSYADLLRGNGGVHGHGAKVVSVEGKGSLYPLHCIGKSILGYTKVIMSVGKIRQAIEGEGMSEVGLSYVGGVTFMLTFKDKVTASESMKQHSQFFGSIFSKFSIWNGEDVPFSRLRTYVSLGCHLLSVTMMYSIELVTYLERSVAIWVSELCGQGSPKEDGDDSLSSSDSDSEMESDSDDSEELEDLEEGEIKQDLEKNDRKHGDAQGPEPSMVDSPVENGSSSEAHDSPVAQETMVGKNNSCMGMCCCRLPTTIKIWGIMKIQLWGIKSTLIPICKIWGIMSVVKVVDHTLFLQN
ncbi:putative RNA recognition motif domain, nucleotide-binding alpha-beta plait domain superfamily [Helianthus anomalus]